MKSRDRSLLTYSLISTMLILGLGCTKERAFVSLPNDPSSQSKPESKGLFDTSAEYLYVPSSLNSTRTTDATFPMYMGEAKIVKLKINENSLDVVEIDSEDRYSGNPVNAKPVLTIPIENIDFRCAKDADGKCTNKEEEDSGKPWAARRYIKVKPNDLAVQEVSFLPVEIKNLFYSCYNEVGSEFLGFKVDKNNINIDIEKTYKTVANSSCSGKISSLSDLTFKVAYHYSLAKLDTITSPGYKSLSYSRADENMFGFFDTNTLKLDRDNNSTVDSKKTYLNRWNPERKTIPYYLSENFNKPENAKIKEATYVGINNINKSLKKAGANLQIELHDALPNQNPGDLRVNSIVMVEDPVNYGILGYGPTAANPRTGEIVHGRTALYLGVMKSGIKRAYDDLVKEKLSKIAKSQASTQTEPATDGSGDIVTIGGETNSQYRLAPELIKYNGSQLKLDAKAFASIRQAIEKSHGSTIVKENVPHSLAANLTKKSNDPRRDIANRLVDTRQLIDRAERIVSRKPTLRDAIMLKDDAAIKSYLMSVNCFFDAEDFNFHDAIEKNIDTVIADVGAKPWIELSETEKDKVLDALLPFVWIPTLIHEVGHNLGLRHNFAGSEDKDNFYTPEELAQEGLSRPFSYSSVMDYGYRSTNELQIMGKYDIAALRFGYAEKIEEADGSIVSLKEFNSTPKATAKKYKYCTDEHVEVNPNCNRFDEGTSLTEVAQHWINMYESSYARRNFRNGLLDYSLYDDATQISRISLIMNSLRTMFERYDDIKQTFNLTDDAKEWEQIAFLKDLKQATKMAGNFFINVIETPDTLCAAAAKSAPNTIVGVVPLRNLSPFAISCFDEKNVQLNPQYEIVGQAGKSFQSRKDPESNNPYLDQIDVRGIWIDKLLATKALVGRLTGITSFDEFTGNFLDMQDMKAPVQNALASILLDEVVTDVPIYTKSGQVLVAQIPVSLYAKEESLNGHKIMAPLHPGVQAFFGIPDKGVNFQVKLLEILRAELPSVSQDNDETSLLNSVSVLKSLPVGRPIEDFLSTDLGLNRVYVNPKSEIASQELMSREVVIAFDSLGEEKLQQILANLEAAKPIPDNATDTEKLAYLLGADVIGKYLDGGFKDRSFYAQMLL